MLWYSLSDEKRLGRKTGLWTDLCRCGGAFRPLKTRRKFAGGNLFGEVINVHSLHCKGASSHPGKRLTIVVVAAAMSSLTRNATIQGLNGEEAAAHFPATTADTSSHGNSSKMRPTAAKSSTEGQTKKSLRVWLDDV